MGPSAPRSKDFSKPGKGRGKPGQPGKTTKLSRHETAATDEVLLLNPDLLPGS